MSIVDYLHRPPSKDPHTKAGICNYVNKAFEQLKAHFSITVSLFYPSLNNPTRQLGNLSKEIDSNYLEMAKMYLGRTNDRLKSIDAKAEKLIAIVGILLPLGATLLNRVSKTCLPLSIIQLLLLFVSFCFLTAAFVNAFRARRLSESDNIGMEAFIEPSNATWKEYKVENEIKLHLYCASSNDARADFKGNLTRASEAFTFIGFILLIFSILIIFPGSNSQKKDKVAQLELSVIKNQNQQTEIDSYLQIIDEEKSIDIRLRKLEQLHKELQK